MIWSSRLPHANSVSKSDKWRYQCFVRFVPSLKYSLYSKMVSESVSTSKIPPVYSTRGITGFNFDEQESATPFYNSLDSLEKKLYGIEEWN